MLILALILIRCLNIMSGSIFKDKSVKPDVDSLAQILGTSSKLWFELRKYLKEKYGPLIEEWKYYNPKSGWLLKLLKKKRNLFFFIPYEKYFNITFVFGDKAVSVIEKSNLQENIINELLKTRKYAEGRGIGIDVKTADDIENIKQLVDIKINN